MDEVLCLTHFFMVVWYCDSSGSSHDCFLIIPVCSDLLFILRFMFQRGLEDDDNHYQEEGEVVDKAK